MKKKSLVLLCTFFCLFLSVSTIAQDTTKKTDAPKAVEEHEGPIVFKFEPDFTSKNNKRKAEIAHTRSIIDTLSITERKRVKLLRDLYRKGVSKRLEKALLADNTFEDNEQ